MVIKRIFVKQTEWSVCLFFTMSNKKAQVMLAATYLFSELGFENTSMAKICIEAGVSKGLVYHHFASKKELLRSIFSETTQRMIEMNDASVVVSNPKNRLVILIKELFQQLRTDKLFFQLNLSIMIQPSTKSILKDLIQERAAHLLASVKTIFKLIDNENHELLSFVFIAEIDGIALDYLTVFDNYPLEKLENHLIEKYGK